MRVSSSAFAPAAMPPKGSDHAGSLPGVLVQPPVDRHALAGAAAAVLLHGRQAGERRLDPLPPAGHAAASAPGRPPRGLRSCWLLPLMSRLRLLQQPHGRLHQLFAGPPREQRRARLVAALDVRLRRAGIAGQAAVRQLDDEALVERRPVLDGHAELREDLSREPDDAGVTDAEHLHLGGKLWVGEPATGCALLHRHEREDVLRPEEAQLGVPDVALHRARRLQALPFGSASGPPPARPRGAGAGAAARRRPRWIDRASRASCRYSSAVEHARRLGADGVPHALCLVVGLAGAEVARALVARAALGEQEGHAGMHAAEVLADVPRVVGGDEEVVRVQEGRVQRVLHQAGAQCSREILHADRPDLRVGEPERVAPVAAHALLPAAESPADADRTPRRNPPRPGG